MSFADKREISSDDFDTISDYVIVSKHLCEHLTSVSIHDMQVLSYPMCIEDEKVTFDGQCEYVNMAQSCVYMCMYVYVWMSQYDRNALFFTLSFVLTASADTVSAGLCSCGNCGGFGYCGCACLCQISRSRYLRSR